MSSIERIGLLGFGEVGQILGADLAGAARYISAFDLKFSNAASPPLIAAEQNKALEIAKSAGWMAKQSDIIFSAVTAAQTETAATSVSDQLQSGTWFVDLNSASPEAKQNCANLVNAHGGRYVEAAVMSPVPPKRLGTPLLLGGPHAQEFEEIATNIGWTDVKVYSHVYGQASAAKMCRSVMIKGIETLLLESLVAARHYGVEQTVLTSLDDLFPGPDWAHLARYMIGRTLEHGGRRAEEMREVAKTVSNTALTPHMSLASARAQDWAKQYPDVQKLTTLEAVLDALCETARNEKGGSAA